MRWVSHAVAETRGALSFPLPTRLRPWPVPARSNGGNTTTVPVTAGAAPAHQRNGYTLVMQGGGEADPPVLTTTDTGGLPLTVRVALSNYVANLTSTINTGLTVSIAGHDVLHYLARCMHRRQARHASG